MCGGEFGVTAGFRREGDAACESQINQETGGERNVCFKVVIVFADGTHVSRFFGINPNQRLSFDGECLVFGDGNVFLMRTVRFAFLYPEVGAKAGNFYLMRCSVCFASEDVDHRSCRSIGVFCLIYGDFHLDSPAKS